MKRLLTCAVLLALGLSLVSTVHAADSDLIYCRVTLALSDSTLGVEFLPTPGSSNTLWELGEMYCGGVKESWYQLGPASFVARNIGSRDAYFYLEAGDGAGASYYSGTTNLAAMRVPPTGYKYALEFATNVTAGAPSYRPTYTPDGGMELDLGLMGTVKSGGYLPFALRFWAPPLASASTNQCEFMVRISARSTQ